MIISSTSSISFFCTFLILCCPLCSYFWCVCVCLCEHYDDYFEHCTVCRGYEDKIVWGAVQNLGKGYSNCVEKIYRKNWLSNCHVFATTATLLTGIKNGSFKWDFKMVYLQFYLNFISILSHFYLNFISQFYLNFAF